MSAPELEPAVATPSSSSQTPAPPDPTTTTPAPSSSSAPQSTSQRTSTSVPTQAATSAAAAMQYGVPAGTKLTPSGSITATPGQVIENLDITGHVYVGSGVHGVVIRNSRISGDGGVAWGIETADDGSVSADHVTLRGNFTDAAVAYNNVTVTHADIYGMTNDGAKVGNNFTMTDSWLHDFTPETGAHADALQIMERVANVLIQRNLIDPGTGGPWSDTDSQDRSVNSALILNDALDQGTAGRVVIDSNVIGGGGYTVYFTLPGDTRFTNNQFVRDSYLWGPVDPRASADVWSGNKFSDNGETIVAPVK
ncbi:MAG TPA: hypothetical protein VJ870_18395 [Amycolatopsis sp.]|nr:hypothetical protein [Amycolatopsis sp.]